MDAAVFEDTLHRLVRCLPFQPFVIELVTGERLHVYERDALMFRGRTGTYFAPDKEMTIVDCENVKQIG